MSCRASVVCVRYFPVPYFPVALLAAMQNRCFSPRMKSSLSTGAGVASTVSSTSFVATICRSLASLMTTVVPLRAVR